MSTKLYALIFIGNGFLAVYLTFNNVNSPSVIKKDRKLKLVIGSSGISTLPLPIRCPARKVISNKRSK